MLELRYTKKSDANNRIVISISDFTIDTEDSGDVSIVQGIINAASALGLMSADVQVQFSANDTSWHDTYTDGDAYIRFSFDGTSWGASIPIKQDMTGTFEELVAGDITPDTEALVEIVSRFAIQTTGGDTDVMTGDAEFVAVRGHLDDSLNPFMATHFVSTKMNLVDSSQYITIDSKKSYYFPVKKGEWGSYGTSNKNNGYIIVGGTPVAVYYSATKPTASSYGSACPTHTDQSKTYYLPGGDGWLVVVMSDDTVPACHVVWNSEMDTEGGTFGNVVKELPAPHAWGWAALYGPEYSVFDETNARDAKKYPRIERINLGEIASSSWAATTETVDETTTYIYKYTLPTAAATKMKPNGLWRSNYSGLEVDHENGKLVIKSTTITTAAALVTALSGKMFYYELNTVTPVAIATETAKALLANTIDNFGLSYFLNSGELTSISAFVTEAFHQTGKGQLFDGLARQTMIEEIVASAFNQLNKRVGGIDNALKNEIVNLLVTAAKGKQRQLNNLNKLFSLSGSGSPITGGIVPDFVGQMYDDTTNKVTYRAYGISSASDWKALNS